MVPIFKPSIRRKDMESVLSCMVSDEIGHGVSARRFISALSEYLGCAGGVAVREYGRAIDLVLRAMDLSPGQKVVLSPLAPAIYHEVMKGLGLVPLFVDVDPTNGCVTAAEVERLKGEEPSLLLVTSPLGFLPDMQALSALGIPIVEDVSMSIGGNVGERKAGSFGQYVIVSLEAENIITSGGGAVALAASRRELGSLRNLAGDLPPSALLPDLNAALALIQIGAIEQYFQRRKEIARIFAQSLAKTRHKVLIQSGECDNTWYSFPVLMASGLRECVQYARKKGIETIPAFQDTIMARSDFGEQKLSNARALFLRCLLFPLYPTLGKQNVALIAKVLSTLP